MAKNTDTKPAPKAKFVAPPKPKTEPIGLDIEAYTYVGANGERRFWQGYDAKFKSALQTASRDPKVNGKTRAKAVRVLVERGWSDEAREAAYLEANREKEQRIADRAKAKAEKAKTNGKAKNGKSKAAPKKDEAVTPVEGPELTVVPEPETEGVVNDQDEADALAAVQE